MKAIINATTYDFQDFHENQYILFDDTIQEVGPMSSFKNANYDIIDAKQYLVMPSMIVGHSHIYSTFARGLNVPFHPESFQDILDQLWWRLDRNLDNQMNYYSAIVSAVDHLRNGVTTMIDHHASGEIKGSLTQISRGLEEVGLRGIYCFETSDRFDTDACLEENMTFINDNNTSFKKGLFGLHASMSLSDATLQKVKEVIGDTPIHIHVAESKEDVIDCFNKHQSTLIERLEKFGLLNENSIIVHGLFLTPKELEIIKKHNCVVALNVTSNMNNSVGIPNYKLLREKRVRVIMGNDGISSSITTEYLMLYYAMHLLDKTPTTFGLHHLQEIIVETYRYASAILDVKLGQISKGFAADLLIVPYIAPTPISKENALGHLFFGLFNSFKPSDVFVAGKQLVHNYQIDNELSNQYQKAQDYAQQLWDKIDKEEVKS